jgi:hypothetical protein
MFNRTLNYFLIILLHIIIGVVIFLFPAVSKVYGFGIILVGFYYVFINRNQNHEVLHVAAYMVGSEVLLRMTNGNPFYEFTKYGISAFIILGMYYRGFAKHATPYWIFLAFLIPGIIVGTYALNYDTEIRKTISFNISGPICLGIASLYSYTRRVKQEDINKIVFMLGLPIICMTTYLILYTPSIRDVVTNTGSNFETSGGFGPNQVSTMLGLGAFVFVSRMMFSSPNNWLLLINALVAVAISYRGLVTFSRGGVLTAIIMLSFLVIFTYAKLNKHGRLKLNILFFMIVIALSAVWFYSSQETGGLINKRYANQDAAGRVKESQFTGREVIFEHEIDLFLRNPIFGIGVAKSWELRQGTAGENVLSHNEISRMLCEHGSFGVAMLLILFFTPLFLYLDNRHHIFLLCFLTFWILTINHAAMRVAAPAFVYSLSLLKVIREDENATLPV